MAAQVYEATQRQITRTTMNENLKTLGFIANKNPATKGLDQSRKTIVVFKRQKTQNTVCW